MEKGLGESRGGQSALHSGSCICRAGQSSRRASCSRRARWLGSPADVLVESTKLIQKTIPTGSISFQVDPGARDKSEFFKALSLDPGAFLQAKWCDFMAAVSQRLV